MAPCVIEGQAPPLPQRMQARACARSHTHTLTLAHSHTRTRAHTHTRTHTRTRARARAHTHAHTRARTRRRAGNGPLGFDAHLQDDIGQMALVEDDYHWMTIQLMAVADAHASGRLVSCLEGGYNLQALAACVDSHLRALSGTG